MIILKAILCEVKEKWNLEISYDSYEDIDIVETYCTMTSILGNDFIPHLLTVELKTDGIDKLVSATKKSIEQKWFAINKGKINYDTLKIYLNSYQYPKIRICIIFVKIYQ